MGKQLARVVMLVSLMTAMASAFADARVYIDENGHQQIEYIKGWTNPDFVVTGVSRKDFDEFQESMRIQDEKYAVEMAIKKTMHEKGLNRTQAIEYMLSPKKCECK